MDEALREIGPQKKQEISGRIIYIDPAQRLIELEGPILQVTAKTRILNADGKVFPISEFVDRILGIIDAGGQLPLVAVGTQLSRGDHPLATRIRLIASFADIERKSNRVIGPLVAVDAGLIELLGAAFTVAENGRILSGKDPATLTELETQLNSAASGLLEARMEVTPPAPGGGLAVVTKLVVAPAPGEVEVRGGAATRDDRVVEEAISLLGISPFDGETDVGFVNDDGALQATIRIEVDVNVRKIVREKAFMLRLFPAPLEHGELDVGYKSISFDVILEEDTPYELVVALPGVGHFLTVFTTGTELLTTSISGSVVLADLDLDAVSIDRSFVIITDQPPLDLIDISRPGNIDALLAAARSVVPLGRTYEATGLPNGIYYPYAQIVVEAGRDHFIINGFVDGDDDDVPDAVEISDADPNPTVDIVLQLPEPFTVIETSPENRATGTGGGELSISITFSQSIGLLEEEADLIHPQPLRRDALEISGATATIGVELEEAIIYGVVVDYAEDDEGEPLGEPYKFVFATGEIPTGSISGRMFLPRDLPVAQRVIESPAVVELFRIVEGVKEARPFRSFPTRSGMFNLEHVPDGEYALGGFVEVGLPRGLRPGRANEASNRQGPTIPDEQGAVGFLTFETNDDFTQSDLIITQYSLNTLDTDQLTFSTAMIGRVASGEVDLSIPAGAINQIQTPGASGESDFSGDGRIDLGDFFALADVFGRDAVDDLVKYHLDRNGMVGLGDFFIFADAFGATLSKTVQPEEAEFAGSMDVEVSTDESGLVMRASPRVEAEYDRFAFIASVSPDLLQKRPAHDAGRALPLELSASQLLISGDKDGSGTVSFDWVGDPDLSLAEHLVPAIETGAVRALDGTVSPLQPTRAVVRALPMVFQLGQNYPNPFNPATTIHYQLPIAGKARVDIFDLLGQRVRTLVNEAKPAGFYSIGWNGHDDGGQAVASGVYFYRLEIEGFADIKKLMLVK